MSNYLHGAYSTIQTVGAKVAANCPHAIVYIGTAPVHTVAGGASNVNKPILVNSFAEAVKYFGYDDNWASYTLCEAMYTHLQQNGIGPLVLINVLDPAKHKMTEKPTNRYTPKNGRVTIIGAGNVALDSITVTGKERDADYVLAYDYKRKQVTISETNVGSLGTEELEVTYTVVDPSMVEDSDVIGATDGMGLNTGLYAIANVYQLTRAIPFVLCAPGFSSRPEIHEKMYEVSQKVNGHWDVYMFNDLPIMSNDTPLTLQTAATWKKENGYNKPNESVYFPLVTGTDGHKYHLSVLAAANFQKLLAEQDGIPYKSASNTECSIIQNLYLGEAYEGRLYDDAIINEKLNKNGISSAAYVSGRWVIWGTSSADYTYTGGNGGSGASSGGGGLIMVPRAESAAEGDELLSCFETNRLMLFYLSNDFQHRRARDVDKPMTRNALEAIVSEERARLDALLKIGALAHADVHINAEGISRSDMMKGDYSFVFTVTTMPLAKSLTAVVNWTEEGFYTYYEDFFKG